MICFADGGVLDDLIVYRLGEERFLIVANASNAAAVSDALAERLRGMRAVLDDRSLATALVALQGPRSAAILAPLTDVALDGLRFYSIAEGQVAGVPAIVARTGYTGEDGFEIFVDVSEAATIWDALMAAGKDEGVVPVGLGARDTLRLEAGMPLYGNELGPDTTPFEAGLGRVVAFLKEGDFVGRVALSKAEADGPRKKLVGLAVRGRGIARHGYDVFSGDRRVGAITSGTLSPTLGEAIAMAYVTPSEAEPGTIVAVGIRDQRVPAEVVPLPFYRRPV
jgi:aminomethyltransferase